MQRRSRCIGINGRGSCRRGCIIHFTLRRDNHCGTKAFKDYGVNGVRVLDASVSYPFSVEMCPSPSGRRIFDRPFALPTGCSEDVVVACFTTSPGRGMCNALGRSCVDYGDCSRVPISGGTTLYLGNTGNSDCGMYPRTGLNSFTVVFASSRTLGVRALGLRSCKASEEVW